MQQALGGRPDERVIEACRHERRALITLDLDFSNIHAYPPSAYAGIVVLRLGSQEHVVVEAAIRRMLALLTREPLAGMLWIVEAQRIGIHE